MLTLYFNAKGMYIDSEETNLFQFISVAILKITS